MKAQKEKKEFQNKSLSSMYKPISSSEQRLLACKHEILLGLRN